MGLVDPNTLPATFSKAASGEKVETRIDLAEIIGLPDFDVGLRSCEEGCGVDAGVEKAAAKINLTSKAWAYMSSGATDQYSGYWVLPLGWY